MYSSGEDIKNQEKWKTYKITLTIRVPNEEKAKKLVTDGFDVTMLFEDKCLHQPTVVEVKEQ